MYVSSGKWGKRKEKTRNRKNSKHEIDLSSMLFQKSKTTALDIIVGTILFFTKIGEK